MTEENYEDAIRNRVLIRLDTLIRLRWYAIIGQAGAVLLVAFVFNFPIPWLICLLLILASLALNVFLSRRFKISHRLPGNGALALLAFDVLQLGMLLYLTGGLQNPFAILLIAPVVVAATSLRQFQILVLGAITLSIISYLAYYHLPLPWDQQDPLEIPVLYNLGVWVAIVCTLAFTAIYAFRVAEEARKLAEALAATELVLQREQHLSALDGLAAAAAHELGTPLATIALVSKEMTHALENGNPLHEDAKLLRNQAERCREILQKLSSLSSEGESIVEMQTPLGLVEEVVVPLRDFGIDIQVHPLGDIKKAPSITRNPGIHYGLGNMIDNAVDFANSRVVIVVDWSEHQVKLEISDDGKGFAPSLLDKLGEPFVSDRKSKKDNRNKGLGLGLFIAKTLLERSGATVTFQTGVQREPHGSGAFIEVDWPLERLMAPDKAVEAETETG